MSAAARFVIRQSDGRTVRGYVHGSGGVIRDYPDALDRMHLAVGRAERGRPLGIYEPEPGCCAVFCTVAGVERVVVDLRGAVVTLDEDPQETLPL